MPTPSSRARSHIPSSNGLNAARQLVLGASRLLALSFSNVAAAAPLLSAQLEHGDGDDPDADSTPLWVYLVASAFLVLIGGVFAGLTIALMGQDSIYLQVLSQDKDEPQHNNARRVLQLLKAGKHWVLVTLLLSNVVVNESLPVVLHRCLGGGVAAVVGSTVLIVIFGEVVPQSVCVRYGLQIGGYMSKPVLALMWLTGPISWPMAKLLDWILGEDHGTVYKKSGLKTLVTLHRSLGIASERLNKDEVTIISAVLDLKEKPVSAVMTPMEDVFVMSEDTVLDERTMDTILSAGYSRIPIHESGNPTNFLGMLLVKILITYDPEDGARVKDFPLATLPETRPETSCLDIVNYFQEGKSHMVLVSESPGNPHGAIGVVTLEDVIEELIGEEIVDESDVYIDVHKAIRRLHPAPNAQILRRQSVGPPSDSSKGGENGSGHAAALKPGDITTGHPQADATQLSSSPKVATFLMRRSSAGVDGKMTSSKVPVRANFEDIREHLKHLGPSNPATNPKNTRLSTVTIKPGIGTPHPRPGIFNGDAVHETMPDIRLHRESVPHENDEDDEHTALLRPKSPLGVPKDGVQAVRQSYGAATATDAQLRLSGTTPPQSLPTPGSALDLQQTESFPQLPTPGALPRGNGSTPNLITDPSVVRSGVASAAAASESGSSPASDHGSGPTTPRLRKKSTTVRSGSITENIFETRGFRKVVLETNADEDEDSGQHLRPQSRGDRASNRGSARVSDVEEESHDGDSDGHSGFDTEGDAGGSQQGGSSGHGHGHHGGKKKNKRKKRKNKS